MSPPDHPAFEREEQAWDERFSAVLRSLPLPATPQNLTGSVRHRLRRRRQRAVAGFLAVAAVLLGVVLWQRWPTSPGDPVTRGPVPPPPANGTNGGLPETALLFSAPPVDPLDVLDRHQAALVVVLQQLDKE
jgi:hypothetical protein